MKTTRFFTFCWAALLTFIVVRAETSAAKSTTAASGLVWDAMEKTVIMPGMTNLARFTFTMTNTSPDDITVFSTQTTCDCTVAEAAQKLPWRLAPNESGSLNVNVNIKGRFGLFEKHVAVASSIGTQDLAIRVQIPLTPAPFNTSVREQDVMAAKADRQAVFRGSCAACHTYPAKDQTGEVLFAKACGICHTAEHRAQMVPDLAAIPHLTDAEFWRNMITLGKPGTLMPAFGLAEGGILSTNQIESLVDYLLKHNPPKLAADPPTSTAAAKKND